MKQDTYHLKRRFMEVLPRTHPAYNAFSLSLSETLLPVYEPDRERLADVDADTFRKKARKFIPPGTGKAVLQRVGTLLSTYKRTYGDTFITPAVEKVFADQQALVTDEYDLISGGC